MESNFLDTKKIVNGDAIGICVRVKKSSDERLRLASYPTLNLSSIYQTGQTYKNIIKKELAAKDIDGADWSGTFTIRADEYLGKLAPDLFGLLRADAFLQFERNGEIQTISGLVKSWKSAAND